jgi:hypothetical protein
MGAGYDIGASFSSSSGVQGGNITGGDFIVGGSGGANQVPGWIWIALVVVGAVVLLKFLFSSKRR